MKTEYLTLPLALMLVAATQSTTDPTGSQTAPSNQPAATAATANDNGARIKSVRDSAGRIASQPAHDVGIAKTKFPPVLVDAYAAPYASKGLKSCKQIAVAFHSLTDVIGPDFKAGEVKKENRVGKLAEAGGQTVINSFIPFRGLLREVTGAAPAQRRLNAMIDAGYARRGYLRGLYETRRCRAPVLF